MQPADRSRAAFLEFRRSRSPQALTEVFDLCAQELLLVAHHLAQPGVAPEDLLQATFLEAIRVAERYDERRPLMSWLCGILVNVARTANRTGARAYDSERVRTPAVEDPAELAYAREFAEAVVAAIADFPATQREVLTLRLVHGLTPTEIAHALGHPVGSVKSWIHRGVERLKQVLPVGFAASLVCVTKAELTLDAVREAVLAHARSSPTPSTAPRSWLRSPGAAAAATVATALVIALGATRWMGSADEPPRESALATATRSLGDEARAFDGSPSERAESSSSPAARAGDARLHAHFASDGAPASIAVRVEPLFGVDPFLRAFTLRTDAAGWAALPELAPGEYELTPDRGSPQTVVLPLRDALELAIPPGARVAGVVRDANGRSIEGAAIWLSIDGQSGAIAARSDAQGRYEVRDVPPRRVVSAIADDVGCAPLRCVGESSDAQTFDFVLPGVAATVSGTVRSARGEPVAGAFVQIGSALDDGWHANAFEIHEHDPPQLLVTDELGRFECRSAPAREALRVWSRAVGARVHTQLVDTSRGGRHELSIVLDAGSTWTGTLDASELGAANVLLIADQRELVPADEPTPRWAHPRAFVAPHGAFSLAGIAPGRVFLSADDRAGRWDLHEELVAPDARIDWSPALAGERHVRGSALTTSGIALAGYRIKLIDSDGVVNGALVGDDGTFELSGVEDRALTLWLYGPGGVYAGALSVATNVRAGPELARITLADEARPSAFVVARVLDAARQPTDRVRASAARDNTIVTGAIDAEGRCRIGPLPPGAYFLTVAGTQGLDFVHGPFELRAGETLDLGDFEQRTAGRVHVRIAGVEASASVGAALLTLDGSLMPTYFVLRGGEATTLPVPPGRYLFTTLDATAGFLQREVEVREDDVTELGLRTPQTAPVEIELDGERVCAGLALRLTAQREGTAETLRWPARLGKDVAGRALLRLALEPGRYRIEIASNVGDRGAAEFELDPARAPVRAHVELR